MLMMKLIYDGSQSDLEIPATVGQCRMQTHDHHRQRD